ncbi:MAG: ABC transporter permease, partial [Alphaproteobacteria bacterium]|nr:ABC transporter permease [Alphaproteobacteria bacterium]
MTALELPRRPRRAARDAAGPIGLIVLGTLALLCFGAPVIEAWSGYNVLDVDLANRMAAPSLAHPLGTDDLGRDLALRLLYGGQVSLAVGLAAALAAMVIGTIIGLMAGFYGGRTDGALMRVTDFMLALPLLPLLIVLSAADLSKLGVPAALAQSSDLSLYRIVFIIGLTGWTLVARLVRGATLSVRTRDFIAAARVAGAGPLRLMVVHILPNVASPLLVATTLSVGNVILTESVLSFLGLGIQPPTPS